MGSENGTPPKQKRPERLRTERASSSVYVACISDEARTDDSSVNSHEKTISRTEQPPSAAPRAPAPLGLDGTARVLTASLLDSALKRHWAAREAWASNRCIADHYCENTESVVRRWRSGEKSIPLAALAILPATLAEELAHGILRSRGVDVRRAVATLGDAVAAIEAPVADDDRDEVMAQLRDARDRIIARLDRLAGGGR